ncbi:putative transcriptional regulator YheO [Kibdelosporangium banguiense]|uniref:Transcriptional regulator YheO n=1 Tax=Kibdelosporangium banguiense TaxID=1365924 RepID=A0ABS4TXY3_9PSEU|nr:PAS domain-containing protein [Kibdelosporangium banguiense]MBP2329239.1 putative transcriptional regulator YheO [Kibdelosporangium banguiense]
MSADPTPGDGVTAGQPHSDDDRAEARTVVAVVGPVVRALAQAFAPRSEVVLHDLTRLPGSIAAIAGEITGRQVGGPATDLGLRTFQSGWKDHLIGYRAATADGTPLRSSSIFFHGSSGRAIACLCINTDISSLLAAQETLADLTAIRTIHNGPLNASGEHFPATVDSLAEGILRDAIAASGHPPAAMKKRHKLAVVRDLEQRGFFTIREAVDLAAARLEVSRYTIYNYLNEIKDEAG